MKYLQTINNYKVDIERLKAVYFNTIEKIIEWSKDDPNLYDFNAIFLECLVNFMCGSGICYFYYITSKRI